MTVAQQGEIRTDGQVLYWDLDNEQTDQDADMNRQYFYAQSDADALKDYEYACSTRLAGTWDWIVLTAANERQAASYRLQLEKRRREHRLPLGTQFEVVPDFEDKRVGSGGATLNILRVLSEKLSVDQLLEQKILVIHSGGDSKRIPQYSACGKLFGPVPRALSGGYVSTLFDELLICAQGIPTRTGSGMMVFPSDTKLLFNALQLDLLSCQAAGLSMKAPVQVGQDHGVFVQAEDSQDHRNYNVSRFLHKRSEAFLRDNGAVDNANQVNVDTGCIWFGKVIVSELFKLISTNGKIDESKFRAFVNPHVCLNFYADFVYPLAQNSTWQEFLQEAPENGFSSELELCRQKIWAALHAYRLSLVKLIPAQYIHFGMTHEMYDFFVREMNSYDYLNWQKRLNTNACSGCVLNSLVIHTEIPESAYLEDCRIERCHIGEGVMLSNIDIHDTTVPAEVVMHGLELKNNRFVCRIYGREDNPKSSKDAPFLGSTISRLVRLTGIANEAVWGNQPASIWNAKIYPVCQTMQEAVDAAVLLYNILHGNADENQLNKWINADRTSLAESFQQANVEAGLQRQESIRNEVQMALFVEDIYDGKDQNACLETICQMCQNQTWCLNFMISEAKKAEFPNNMRLYLAASEFCRRYPEIGECEQFEDAAYDCIKSCITRETFARFGIRSYRDIHIVQDSIDVELPVRVNFCGSPSDAAPYCLEHGGTMIDGTLILKGKRPIHVTVKRIPNHFIVFGSLDQGQTQIFNDIESIRACGNPLDSYALHKACLVASGLISMKPDENSLEDICKSIGGGLEIVTSVDVPKGSGLGTSSILAAAVLKGVNEILGIEPDEEMIYAQVFLVEQLMNTGGGWQDQVGGFTSGIKYFTAEPGPYQKIQIERLALSPQTMDELNRRFALIFSGQRRLARNVLRQEMNQCIRNDQDALDTIVTIQEYCALMRFYLLRGDITSFAGYITKQFELVKKLDKGASNTYIEYIFNSCADLLDGWAICGAGGGGFLQVILKENTDKSTLIKRVEDTFGDCGVEVWDCEFI